MGQLSWDVFVAPELALVDDDLPRGLSTRTWGPTSATLITGREDAVLVDALLTTAQATALAARSAGRFGDPVGECAQGVSDRHRGRRASTSAPASRPEEAVPRRDPWPGLTG